MKALRCGIDQIKGLSCGSTFIIYQPFLKSAYLLHKKGFVDSQMVATVRITANRVFLVSYIFVTLHVYLYSEPLLLEHKEVVVDMISRSFAEKGDLTTLANVTYDNIAEQVSSTLQMYLFCLYF